MKKLFLPLAYLAILVSTLPVLAQNTSVPIPDFKYQIMAVKADNSLLNLEKTGLESKAKIGIFSASKVFLEANGCCSKVTLSGKSTDQFVIKIDPGIDPQTVVELYQFQQNGDQRKLLVKKANMGSLMSGSYKRRTELDPIELSFQKVAEGVYLITHNEQLQAGEYLFLVKTTYNTVSLSERTSQRTVPSYCFSVGK